MPELGRRMNKPILSAAALLVIVAAPLIWVNRSYVDALITNNVGDPTVSETAAAYIPTEGAVVRLAVAGDVGTGGSEEFQTASVMDSLEEQQGYDALLLLGDNIYEDGDPSLVQSRVFEPFGPVLDDGTTLLSVLGNHDVSSGFGAAQAEALGMPNEWYATEIGNTTVVALDSNQAGSPEQIAWLRKTLASITNDWTIVMMHHPAYSAGWHGSEPSVVENFVPLFEEFGVDLVLSGHDHDYQRSKPIGGVTYVVSGAAAKLRPAGVADFTAVSWSTYSFVDILVYADRLQVQAVNHDGRAIDSFVLEGA